MYNLHNGLTSTETEIELLKYRIQVTKYYRQGYGLGELCRKFRLDITSILFLLRKSRLKKKKLYIIFENQNDRTNVNKDIINEKETHFIEKFFPYPETYGMVRGSYWHWKEKFKKAQERKDSCNHSVRHISCGRCNKILRDASNIPFDDVITYKIDEK